MNLFERLPRPSWPQVLTSAQIVDLGVYALFLGRRTEAYSALVTLAGPRPGDTVVDVGSGTGYLAGLVAERVAPTGQVIGVEPGEDAVARARRHAPPGCRFEVGSALHLPVADGQADLVMSSLLIHHIEPSERQAAIVEMARVLRPGGRAFVADLKRIHPPGVNAVAGAVVPCFRNALTTPELVDLVAGAGLTVTRAGVFWGRMRYVDAVRS